jgi:hypothetical protein
MALGYDTRLMIKDGDGNIKEYLHPAYEASHSCNTIVVYIIQHSSESC